MKTVQFDNVATLKREAKTGRYMKGGYYDKMQSEDWREIVATQSNGLYLKMKDGKRSFFEFPKASTCKIENGKIEIFEERVKYGNSDIPFNTSWFQYNMKAGKIKAEEIERYIRKVAEYWLGEA